jgi:hypothetical protein
MQQARQCWVRRCWFCCVPNCIKVHSVIQLQGETLQPSDITGLVLELDSETHSLEDEDIFFSEWMVTLTKTEGITHTNCTQWTNNTKHRPTTTCSLLGVWVVMTNRAIPHQ